MVLPVAVAMLLVARLYQSWRLVAGLLAVVVAAFFLPATELDNVLKLASPPPPVSHGSTPRRELPQPCARHSSLSPRASRRTPASAIR